VTGIVLLLVVIVLFGALAIHHFIKTRRGLRTGAIEGLVIAYSGNGYSRENDPQAFEPMSAQDSSPPASVGFWSFGRYW